jgi:hypothetical protein
LPPRNADALPCEKDPNLRTCGFDFPGRFADHRSSNNDNLKRAAMNPRRTGAERAKDWLAALGFIVLLVTAAGQARAQLPDPVRFGVAIEMGDMRAARAWLDAGLPPDFLADRIGSGLMIAAWEGNIPMMELFVSRGANVNAVNANGEQALLHAAWRGRTDAVRWLLDRGAQINREGLAWSALHYAVFAGHTDTAKVLIARGADINARSTNGSSPLMMAAREGRDDLAQMLVGLGADTRIRNDWDEDALVWSMRHGNVKIARMVTTPEQFAAAARKPADAWGEPVRSKPVPERIAVLIEEMRRAEYRGRLSPEMQGAYLAAVRELREMRRQEAAALAASGAPPVVGVPSALEITARRDAPGQERAELRYEPTGQPSLAPAPSRNPFSDAPDTPVQR